MRFVARVVVESFVFFDVCKEEREKRRFFDVVFYNV